MEIFSPAAASGPDIDIDSTVYIITLVRTDTGPEPAVLYMREKTGFF